MSLFHPKPLAADAVSDADLLPRAQAGDAEALRAVVQHSNQRLFRVARAVVGNDFEAEDVVQETYARAFAALKTFRGEASLLTWLTSIALNEARGRLRKRKLTVDVDQIDAARNEGSQVIPFPLGDDANAPEASAARTQVRHLIEAAVDDLPSVLRIVFVMRDVEEYSIEETSRLLDVKPETIKTRLHRARRQLRGALHRSVGDSVRGAFPFLGARCQRMTEAVIARMASSASV